MSFGLQISGLEEIARVATALRAASLDTRAPRTIIGEEMMLRTHDNWMAGRAPDGSAWPASARALGFGGQTMLRSGDLLAGNSFEIPGSDVLLFNDDKRAGVHHEGKTIRPKPGKRALAIPMSDAVAEAHQAGVSIKEQYPDGFVIQSEAGNAFIVRQVGDGSTSSSFLGNLEFLYMLVDEVEMPKRVLLGFGDDDQQYGVSVFLRHFAAAEARATSH